LRDDQKGVVKSIGSMDGILKLSFEPVILHLAAKSRSFQRGELPDFYNSFPGYFGKLAESTKSLVRCPSETSTLPSLGRQSRAGSIEVSFFWQLL
jgi:hypothetical protein